MDTATGMSSEPLKIRANRKVVEARCGICEQGFELAEEVYACPFCGGYHHVQCWGANLSCAAAPALAPDERRCPACSQVIKQEALKCRFCGAVFAAELAARIAPEEMPSELAAEAEKLAGESLTSAIVSIFICGPILAPQAISKGNEALKILSDYPQHTTSARAKARAGIVIGVVDISLWVIGFFIHISSH